MLEPNKYRAERVTIKYTKKEVKRVVQMALIQLSVV